MPLKNNEKKKAKEANNKINDCIYNLNLKISEATNKDIHYAKIGKVNVAAWKLIDCFVENKIVDECVQIAKPVKFPKVSPGSPAAYNVQGNRRTTPVSSETKRRSKSLTRIHPIQKNEYVVREDCQIRLDFEDDEDGYKAGAYINLDRCTCAGRQSQTEQCNICRISLLEKEKLDLENALQRLKTNQTLKIDPNQYESLANEYINKYQELKKNMKREQNELLNQQQENNRKLNLENESLMAKIYNLESKITDVCCDCLKRQHHMLRYRAERNELREDKEGLEKQIRKLTEEVQRMKLEIRESKGKIESLETQILNAEHDENVCLKTRSLENTIQNQKNYISEIQKREIQLKNELKEAKQATKDKHILLEKCREEKNVVKTNLSEQEVDNDKLKCEKNQLKKQRQLSHNQIEELKKELKEKERDLQQSEKIIHELSIKLEEIEGKRKEFPVRDHTDFLREKENNKVLRDEIEELEKKLSAEKKQAIENDYKFQFEISNLKILNNRASEKVREVERDYEILDSKYKEQHAILNAERCRFEKDLKELRMRLDEKSSKSIENRWSRSATTPREKIYKIGGEGFMDLDMLRGSPSSLQERYTTAGSRSDTEKENMSLKSELTEALDNIEKLKHEYDGLSERNEREMNAANMTIDSLQREKNRWEQEKVNWKAKFDQIQIDMNLTKQKQVNQQDSSHGKIENLLQQNEKLEIDKGLMRDRIYSLEKENIKLQELEERLHKSTEENKILQRVKDDQQHNLGEKSSQLKKSEARFIKLETDLIFLQNVRTENEDLKISLEGVKKELQKVKIVNEELKASLDGAKRDLGTLEKRYKKETVNRMSSDNTSTKLIDENDRLRRERNSARIDLQKLLREKEESFQTLNTEKLLVTEELEKKEKEKSDLVALFRDNQDKDAKKIQRLELEIETVKSRFATGEKASQFSAYELLQNKNDLETCKHQKKALEDERNELQKENNELENQLQSLNSKMEQFDDSARNIHNLQKQIKDLEEGYRNVTSKLHEGERQIQEQKETIEDQKQENREIYKEKKDLENKLRLALNNEEQASLGKECEDLKILLQQKQKELNNLKSRFQELADSKETSEVLNKIIENLQQEKSDLNQRLQELEVLKRQVNKLDFENSELKKRLQQYAEKFEDIPALKRHMDTLKRDNDELNLKLQEYAAEVEGIPSLKRRIENLQTENAELEKRGKHKDGLLQKSESTVQKMQKDNQKLQTEIISQNQNYDTLKIKLESLKDKNLELDERLRRRSPVVVAEPKNCQNCFKYRNDISDLKREINDLRDRLSEAAGNKLRDNNPNIADLSDMNRPTSLAEKFSSLYTDEYTDAMEVIEDDMDEAASVKVMLDWLKSCYDWCQRLAKEQRETLINRSIGFMQEHGGQKVVLSDRCLIFVKEFQKKIAVESLAVVGQICHVKSVTQQTLSSEKYILKYIKKCSELCWMMQISDPPLYVNFDVNSGENLNKNDYNVFTKSGSKIDYLVWPVLYLHKTGPMLAKGVAQGK